MAAWTFSVHGRAVPQGQLKIVARGGGHPFLAEGNKEVRPWRALVADAARQAGVLLQSPVRLEVSVYMARPKSHYGSGRNVDALKPSSPRSPTVKPDVDKLARAIMDALTGVAYVDDSHVTRLLVLKRYCRAPERVDVVVEGGASA